ncbi:MAG: fumarylacetoacetate hydrolase family protein [bacterium]
MSEYVIPTPAIASVPVLGGGEFPVRRIFCIGKNYANHVKEMGGNPKETPPVFFTKPADAICLGGDIPYPQATQNLHYEGELVVTLKAGGKNIARNDVKNCIFGYAAGCDLTRRDLQQQAKDRGGPWDVAKGFDHSAVIGRITPADRMPEWTSGRLELFVNDECRQQTDLSDMIWPIPDVVSRLSELFELKPGDVIYTGTPEGVGSLVTGDRCRVVATGTEWLNFQII